MADLLLERVSKRYDTLSWGVREIGLRVDDGEVLAIVGASGSGKTTLLRLIAGLEQPCEGQIYLGGQRMTTLPPWERDIGWVAEAAALLPHLTVAENLDWSRQQRRRRGLGTSADQQATAANGTTAGQRGGDEFTAAAIAELLGLSGLLSRKPAELSAGQQQRVALGRALAARPAILLLDEPLGRIDGPSRQSLAWELKRVQRATGSTWLYVTHDRHEAVTVADRIAVLDDGRLLQAGTERELRESPQDVRVMAWWWDGWLSGVFGEGSSGSNDGRVTCRFPTSAMPPIELDWKRVASVSSASAVGNQTRRPVSPVVSTPRNGVAVWPAERVSVRRGSAAVAAAVAVEKEAEKQTESKESGERPDESPGVAGAAVVACFGRVVERRESDGREWALVALEPAPAQRMRSETWVAGNWEKAFEATVARGWVWGRIRDEEEIGRGNSTSMEAGTRVVVEFEARHACWFERSWDG